MATPEDIDALLPQTQCRRCGYDGCRPYAEAIATGDANINRCSPGGNETVLKLAELTGQTAQPIAADCGMAWPPKVAFIREDECIGCTRCIQACPVDAIVGAAKQMHTVLAEDCTGCELCVPVCPVDCIDMPKAAAGEGQPVWPPATELDAERATQSRQRYQARQLRLNRYSRDNQRSNRMKKAEKRSTIADALARAKARRAERQ